jgi:hypothetical protein
VRTPKALISKRSSTPVKSASIRSTLRRIPGKGSAGNYTATLDPIPLFGLAPDPASTRDTAPSSAPRHGRVRFGSAPIPRPPRC